MSDARRQFDELRITGLYLPRRRHSERKHMLLQDVFRDVRKWNLRILFLPERWYAQRYDLYENLPGVLNY
jgi:hypothetical protein